MELVEKPNPLDTNRIEEDVLGNLILEAETRNRLDTFESCQRRHFTPKTFNNAYHQWLYTGICQIYSENGRPDLSTLDARFRNNTEYQTFGGYAKLSDLVSRTPTACTGPYYVVLLHANWMWRKFNALVDEAKSDAKADLKSVETVLGPINRLISDLFTLQENDPCMVKAPENIHTAAQELRDIIDNGSDAIKGVKTNYKRLDQAISGLRNGEMIVLAARPSVGKSALALNMAVNIVKQSTAEQKQGVLFISIEMPILDLAKRILVGESEINLQKALDKTLSTADKELQKARVTEAEKEIASLPLYLISQCPLQVTQLIGFIRLQLHCHPDIKVIMIDYLQLLHASEVGYQNPPAEIAFISAALKKLAKDTNLPVLALAQLNRDNVHQNRPPELSDLKGSGAIEQDADVVLMLDRKIDPKNVSNAPIDVDVLIRKNRHGSVGGIEMTFEGSKTQFIEKEKASTFK